MAALTPCPTSGIALWIGARHLRASVAGRRARDNPSVGQCHAARVDQMRTISRQITVDDERVAKFDVAFFPPAARERTRATAFTRPFGDVTLVVFDIDVEERMRVRPLDLRDGADEPHRLTAVEFGGERMVGSCRRSNQEAV